MTLSDVMLNSGGRRFLLSLLALISAHWLAYLGRLSSEGYGIVMVGVVGAFVTGVTMQKIRGTAPGQSDG